MHRNHEFQILISKEFLYGSYMKALVYLHWHRSDTPSWWWGDMFRIRCWQVFLEFQYLDYKPHKGRYCSILNTEMFQASRTLSYLVRLNKYLLSEWVNGQSVNNQAAYVLGHKNDNVASCKLLVWNRRWQKPNSSVP